MYRGSPLFHNIINILYYILALNSQNTSKLLRGNRRKKVRIEKRGEKDKK